MVHMQKSAAAATHTMPIHDRTVTWNHFQNAFHFQKGIFERGRRERERENKMPVHFRVRKYSDSEEEDDVVSGREENEMAPLLRNEGRRRRKEKRSNGVLLIKTGIFLFIIVAITWYVLNLASLLARDTKQSIGETMPGQILENDFRPPPKKSVEFLKDVNKDKSKLPKKFFEHMVYDMNHPDDLLRAIENGGVNKAVEELQEYVKFKEAQRKRESFSTHLQEFIDNHQ